MSNLEYKYTKIFIILIIILVIFWIYKYEQNCTHENFNPACSANINCNKLDKLKENQPQYELCLPGSIVKPLNSTFYISIPSTVLNNGNYHIRMYNKTNHDIFNQVEGRYVLKETFPAYKKKCNLHCCVTELIYIKDACANWYVFNNEGELKNIKNEKNDLIDKLNYVLTVKLS